ncbi:hypothetical protein HMN09_01396300 [Mycena chlorophos]|uniref:Uncharacterized protein n=1 Tax=Mycena chlorophos TaxID=658473 RepID=A0A8H6VQM0_MYCCL|nr:hypothetical protein HMN09_01396300 [Mycena chlorophos]
MLIRDRHHLSSSPYQFPADVVTDIRTGAGQNNFAICTQRAHILSAYSNLMSRWHDSKSVAKCIFQIQAAPNVVVHVLSRPSTSAKPGVYTVRWVAVFCSRVDQARRRRKHGALECIRSGLSATALPHKRANRSSRIDLSTLLRWHLRHRLGLAQTAMPSRRLRATGWSGHGFHCAGTVRCPGGRGVEVYLDDGGEIVLLTPTYAAARTSRARLLP